MTSLERRLRKLESCGAQGGIVIEVQYTREAPKSFDNERNDRLILGIPTPRVTTIHLTEDDLKL